MIYIPKVKEVSIFKEIAQNIVNPLEIIREGISNCYDAEAKNIYISVKRRIENGIFYLEIKDDGKGMDLETVHKFFNLGDSAKDLGIGEKGLGTKTYYKSNKITVYTQMKNGVAYKVIMDQPWNKLIKGDMPSYNVEQLKDIEEKIGTTIVIENYYIDNPEKYFNYETIKDYIQWFTAGGSFKNFFVNYSSLYKIIKNIQVTPRIFIYDEINNVKEEICGVHQFPEPKELPEEDSHELIYKRSVNYCRHFGPFHKETNINGEYVSVQIYGTVSGINCRKAICKLRHGETYKSRFGVYLAKDFIPFSKHLELLSDANYQHYHILINSQNFDLTADRNNLSNINEAKVKWVIEQAKNIIDNNIRPLAETGYFALRKKEEYEYEQKCKIESIQKIKQALCKLDNLLLNNIPIVKKPYCESQVALLFIALMSNEKTKNKLSDFKKVVTFLSKCATDMICIDKNDNDVLVEIEYKLSNLFKHNHPLGTFEYVICWEVDLNLHSTRQISGTNVIFSNENKNYKLILPDNKTIKVIELKSIVDSIIVDQLNKIKKYNSVG